MLVVAGALKRGDPDRPEDQVLMRALRDFNLPKIVTDDNPIFLGLISDLFPSLDVPRKRELDFEKAVKHAACDLKLQPEESFVLKVVQLAELLYVRHSVFIGKYHKILIVDPHCTKDTFNKQLQMPELENPRCGRHCSGRTKT